VGTNVFETGAAPFAETVTVPSEVPPLPLVQLLSDG